MISCLTPIKYPSFFFSFFFFNAPATTEIYTLSLHDALPIRAPGRYILANSALRLSGIDAYYGDSHVLQKVAFELGAGRLLGLLGRNGAGKSTCMNVSVGLLPPRTGSVEVFGKPVTRMPPEVIAAHGVALVPQGRRVFKSLTVS